MYWFYNLSLIRKILVACAVICLAAGVSAGGKAITGGVLCFIVFGTLGLLLPNKRAKKKDKAWLNKVSPHVPEKYRVMNVIFSILSLVILFVGIYFLFGSLLKDAYFAAIVWSFVALAGFSSFVAQNPRLYNEAYAKNKMVPLKKETTIGEFYQKVYKIPTPYGTPLLERPTPEGKPEGIYRIIDYQWVVFFRVRNDQILIRAEPLEGIEPNFTQSKHVFEFLNQLVELFSFIENTGNAPNPEEVHRIFYERENRSKA